MLLKSLALQISPGFFLIKERALCDWDDGLTGLNKLYSDVRCQSGTLYSLRPGLHHTAVYSLVSLVGDSAGT